MGEFDKIGDTSKILFNMGVIHATLGEHEKAVSDILVADLLQTLKVEFELTDRRFVI